MASLIRSDADPRWVSAADLLHMREGDVATVAAARPLRYGAPAALRQGHLKYTPPAGNTGETP